MDPMTQSAQISSSQGLADGQNSDAKDSKFSDSFLSSSPVSLIQSPQDKRVVLGSDKPSEGVATSLRFPSQPGSFSPGNYGGESGPPDGQPDSPIKTSPVSERIKALEALAAKKEPDFRNDGGFTHFRERRYEKTPSEQTYSTQQKKKSNAEQESPESPFEVLGEVRQTNEFEDTADWMRAHLPPVPDFSDTVSLTKSTLASEKSDSTKEVQEPDTVIPDVPAAFAGVPDAFVDAPVESPEPKPTLDEPPNQRSVDEESEFDLSFLPTAYVWEQQNSGPQVPPTADTAFPVSPAPPVPPEGSHSPSPPLSPPAIDSKLDAVDAEKTPWGGDLEPVEAAEMDSSEESDDTVIEDGAVVPASSGTADSIDPTAKPASSELPTEEIESPPPEKTQKKLMQVPIINVIETDEPNYSEEEMELEEEEMDEDYEVVKDPTQEAPVSPEPEAEVMTAELPKARPLETEFMEGYSPPSSPVESDGEYSPKHTIFESESETTTKVSESKMDEQNPPVLQDQSFDIPQAQREQSKTATIDFKGKPSTFASMPSITMEDMDFPDYDDEWSDETQDTAVKCNEADVISEGLVHGISSITNLIDTDEKQVYIEKASITKSSFMQDDLYDRQSFDDYSSPRLEEMLNKNDLNLGHEHSSHDDSHIHIEKLSENTNQIDYTEDVQSLDDEDTFPKPVGGQPSPRDYPKDPYYSFQSEPQSGTMEEDNDFIGGSVANSKIFPPEETSSKIQKDAKGGTPERTSDHESTEPECSVSGSTDSFVDFMKECLKSRQGDESADSQESFSTTNESKSGLPPPFQASPTVVVDLEHEELTISALKELGSSQDKEKPPQPSAKVSGCSSADPTAGPIHSPFDSAPHLPPPHNNPPSDSTYSKEVEAIDVWVAEAYHLAEHVLTAILTHLSVKELIHWRDPKKSGVVFGLSLLLLLSLAAFSVISVVSYLLLALLCVTISFRIYKSVVQAVQKSGDGHPFKALMDKDVSIPPETFRKHVDNSLTYINRALKHMSRLFLVEDLVDSLKLAVVMWLLTYVGAVFNGITILILADILLFAVPPIYEKNKTQIDQYIDLARTHINTAVTKLQEKLPGAMKRAKTE